MSNPKVPQAEASDKDSFLCNRHSFDRSIDRVCLVQPGFPFFFCLSSGSPCFPIIDIPLLLARQHSDVLVFPFFCRT